MDEKFEIGQLTKELVAEKLKKMDDPCSAAADLVKRTLQVALDACKEDPGARHNAISEACKGGITGLLLADQNLERGAVLLLGAAGDLAGSYGLDPGETMKSALAGMADLRRFVRPDQLDDIAHEIEKNYMGASEAFYAMVREGEAADKAEQGLIG
jgi:hypothetical protein